MRTIEEVRHARLMQLLESADFPTIQAFADKIERSHAQVSQWKNRSERRNKAGEVTGLSNIDSASARWIEQKVGRPHGWMDNDPVFDNLAASALSQTAAAEPPAPPPGFEDRRVVSSDSDWALLQDLKDAMESPKLARRIDEMRAELAELKAFSENQFRKRLELEQQGQVWRDIKEGATATAAGRTAPQALEPAGNVTAIPEKPSRVARPVSGGLRGLKAKQAEPEKKGGAR